MLIWIFVFIGAPVLFVAAVSIIYSLQKGK
jgi:hypothetical protein